MNRSKIIHDLNIEMAVLNDWLPRLLNCKSKSHAYEMMYRQFSDLTDDIATQVRCDVQENGT